MRGRRSSSRCSSTARRRRSPSGFRRRRRRAVRTPRSREETVDREEGEDATVPAGVVTIAAVGDIVMGSTPNLPPDGGRSFFDDVETDLAGDVVLGEPRRHALRPGGARSAAPAARNCYAFQTPPSYAALASQRPGFTVLNLANNHAFDYGPAGEEQTLAALAKQTSRCTPGARARSAISRSARSRSRSSALPRIRGRSG